MTDTVWVLGFVGLAFTGLAVLAWCAFRLANAVEGLGRELRRTGRRLEPQQSALTDELRALQPTEGEGVSSEHIRSSRRTTS